MLPITLRRRAVRRSDSHTHAHSHTLSPDNRFIAYRDGSCLAVARVGAGEGENEARIGEGAGDVAEWVGERHSLAYTLRGQERLLWWDGSNGDAADEERSTLDGVKRLSPWGETEERSAALLGDDTICIIDSHCVRHSTWRIPVSCTETAFSRSHVFGVDGSGMLRAWKLGQDDPVAAAQLPFELGDGKFRVDASDDSLLLVIICGPERKTVHVLDLDALLSPPSSAYMRCRLRHWHDSREEPRTPPWMAPPQTSIVGGTGIEPVRTQTLGNSVTEVMFSEMDNGMSRAVIWCGDGSVVLDGASHTLSVSLSPLSGRGQAYLALSDSGDLLTLMPDATPETILSDLVMFGSTEDAERLCVLNGWDDHALVLRALDLGLRFRQLDAIETSLTRLMPSQWGEATTLLSHYIDTATDPGSDDFYKHLLNTTVSFIVRILDSGSALENTDALTYAQLLRRLRGKVASVYQRPQHHKQLRRRLFAAEGEESDASGAMSTTDRAAVLRRGLLSNTLASALYEAGQGEDWQDYHRHWRRDALRSIADAALASDFPAAERMCVSMGRCAPADMIDLATCVGSRAVRSGLWQWIQDRYLPQWEPGADFRACMSFIDEACLPDDVPLSWVMQWDEETRKSVLKERISRDAGDIDTGESPYQWPKSLMERNPPVIDAKMIIDNGWHSILWSLNGATDIDIRGIDPLSAAILRSQRNPPASVREISALWPFKREKRVDDESTSAAFIVENGPDKTEFVPEIATVDMERDAIEAAKEIDCPLDTAYYLESDRPSKAIIEGSASASTDGLAPTASSILYCEMVGDRNAARRLCVEAEQTEKGERKEGESDGGPTPLQRLLASNGESICDTQALRRFARDGDWPMLLHWAWAWNTDRDTLMSIISEEGASALGDHLEMALRDDAEKEEEKERGKPVTLPPLVRALVEQDLAQWTSCISASDSDDVTSLVNTLCLESRFLEAELTLSLFLGEDHALIDYVRCVRDFARLRDEEALAHLRRLSQTVALDESTLLRFLLSQPTHSRTRDLLALLRNAGLAAESDRLHVTCQALLKSGVPDAVAAMSDPRAVVAGLVENDEYELAREYARTIDTDGSLCDSIALLEASHTLEQRGADMWLEADSLLRLRQVSPFAGGEFFRQRLSNRDECRSLADAAALLSLIHSWWRRCPTGSVDPARLQDIETRLWAAQMCNEGGSDAASRLLTFVTSDDSTATGPSPLSPAQLDRIVARLINTNRMAEAKRVCRRFSHVSADLGVVEALRHLSEGTILPSQIPDDVLVVLARRYGPDTVASMARGEIDSARVIEMLCECAGQAAPFCRRIQLHARVAQLMGVSQQAVSTSAESEPATVLARLLGFGRKMTDIAREFVRDADLSAAQVASVQAHIYLAALSEVNHRGKSDGTSTAVPVPTGDRWRQALPVPGHGAGTAWSWVRRSDDFARFAQLCPDATELGRQLLVTSKSTAPVHPDEHVAELLVRAHDCFTLGCDARGTEEVLFRVRTLAQGWANSGKYSLLMLAIEGLHRPADLFFLFDILLEHDQFELVLRKKTDKRVEAEVMRAVDTYMRARHPDDHDRLAMIHLRFGMVREIGESLVQQAEAAMAATTVSTGDASAASNAASSRSPPSTRSEWLSVGELFLEAGEVFATAGCYVRAEWCRVQSALIALQARVPDARVAGLHGDKAAARRAMASFSRFEDARTVAEGYGLNSDRDWAFCVFQQCLVEGSRDFFEDYRRHYALTTEFFADVAAQFHSSERQVDVRSAAAASALAGTGSPWEKVTQRLRRLLAIGLPDASVRKRILASVGL